MTPKYYDIGIVPKTEGLAERFIFPFSQLNYLLNGGILDRLTLITSGTDNGKTTIASQIIMSVIEQGYKVFAFFGEDGGAEARDRLYKQCLPFDKNNFDYVEYIQNGKRTNAGEYFLKDDKWNEAHKFFAGKLFLFNNNLPANKDELIKTLTLAKAEQGCRVFLLDNVEMFDLDTENENKGVKEIMVELRRFAIKEKVHIIIVAHIRKIERDVLRPDVFDIKGTSSLTNIAKNIITVIRTDKLNRETPAYKNFKNILSQNGYELDEADSVIEVRKTKGKGIGFCCLKFNSYSNTYYECNRKGVEKKTTYTPKQMKIDELLPVPDPSDLPF